MSAIDHVVGCQLLIVTGKGGVGKSTLSASLARGIAARGRSVLAIEIDPRETLHELFGTSPSNGEQVPAGRGVTALNIDPRRVIEQLVREQLKIDMIARRVLASTVFEHFADGAPGLRELAVLEFVKRMFDGPRAGHAARFDVVILDAPATGHGLALLTAPQLVSDVIRGGPFGRMAAELAEWTATPQRAGVVITTRPEEMPVQEALELRAQLQQRLAREPLLLLVNGVYPPYPDADSAPALAAGCDAAALDLWRRRRRVQEEQVQRLAAQWSGPRTLLPFLPLPRGPALLEALTERVVATEAEP